MFYNHNQTPNASWRSNVDNSCFEFFALNTILPDEEIFVYYGDMSYWMDGRLNTVVL
jgi:SET domain-containing protein